MTYYFNGPIEESFGFAGNEQNYLNVRKDESYGTKGPSIESQKKTVRMVHTLSLPISISHFLTHTHINTHICTHARTHLHHSFLLRSKVNIVPPSSQLSCALDCIVCQHWQKRPDICLSNTL